METGPEGLKMATWQKTFRRINREEWTCCAKSACPHWDEAAGIAWAHMEFEVCVSAMGGYRTYCSEACMRTVDSDAVEAA